MIALTLLVLAAGERAYLDGKVKELGLAPLACAKGEAAYRASFFPAFRGRCALTLRVTGGTATLEAQLEKNRIVEPVDATKTLELLAATKPDALEDIPVSGADGVMALGATCTHEFAVSNPGPGPHRDYLRALVDLGRTLKNEEAMFAAEGLVEYLSREFVSADDHGHPRVLRMLGASDNHEAALKAFFASVANDEDVIFDLRNFSGAGTMFKRDFVAIDRRKGRTVWVMPGDGADYLSKLLGVNRAHVVKTMDEARARLKR